MEALVPFLYLLGAVVSLWFLYRVWVEVGFLWALACLIPLVGLWVIYDHWPTFKGIFMLQVLIAVALALLA